MKYIKQFESYGSFQKQNNVLDADDLQDIKDIFQDIVDEYDILYKKPDRFREPELYYTYTQFPKSASCPYELRIDIENKDILPRKTRMRLYDDMGIFRKRLIAMGFKISFFSIYRNVIIISK